MIAVACFFLFLAIRHGFEPLLLVPIAFGMLLVNIYPDIMLHADEAANGTGGLLYYFYVLDEWSILPSLIFLGVGAAPVYPQVKWLKEHGIDADVIVGAKTKDMLILEEEMKAVSGNYYPCTDDGSYGHSGMVTTMVEELVNEGKKYDVCVAIGPMIMMKFVCLLTKKLEIPTIVSMNPIMVDGTGMCGACRLHVGDEIKFACVDGPEFDGHLVNFDEAMKRQQMYKTQEGRALLKLQEGDTHHGGCGHCGGDN